MSCYMDEAVCRILKKWATSKDENYTSFEGKLEPEIKFCKVVCLLSMACLILHLKFAKQTGWVWLDGFLGGEKTFFIEHKSITLQSQI